MRYHIIAYPNFDRSEENKVMLYISETPIDIYKVTSPVLTFEENSPGSLEFTIHPSSPGYDRLTPMTTEIVVFRDYSEIWAGRIVTEELNFDRTVTIVCEGELGYLNDSVQPNTSYSGMSIAEYVTSMIRYHNDRYSTSDRHRMATHNITVHVTGNSDDLDTNWDTTWSYIDSLVNDYEGFVIYCYDAEKGYKTFNYLSNETVDEYMAKIRGKSSNRCDQAIIIGKNLLDFTKKRDLSEYASVLYPIGSDDLTIQNAGQASSGFTHESGHLYVVHNDGLSTYGRIAKSETWNYITDANTLLSVAEKHLAALYDSINTLEISAVDLKLLNPEIEGFDILQLVHVISKPHNLDVWYRITKIELHLDEPDSNEYTLGKISSTLTGKSA